MSRQQGDWPGAQAALEAALGSLDERSCSAVRARICHELGELFAGPREDLVASRGHFEAALRLRRECHGEAHEDVVSGESARACSYDPS